MVAFHAVFLPALALGAIAYREPPPAWAWLAVAGALAAQGLRWWAVADARRPLEHPGHRGSRGRSRSPAGPYRFLRHPNYLAVVLEMACLPLAWGMWRLALVFTLGNAVILCVPHPGRGAGARPGVGAAFEGKGRFVP